jgi:hypothetical protein
MNKSYVEEIHLCFCIVCTLIVTFKNNHSQPTNLRLSIRLYIQIELNKCFIEPYKKTMQQERRKPQMVRQNYRALWNPVSIRASRQFIANIYNGYKIYGNTNREQLDLAVKKTAWTNLTSR